MTMRTCTECGTVNPPERRFCSSCGSLLDATGASTPATSARPASPAPTPSSDATTTSMPWSPAPVAPPSAAETEPTAASAPPITPAPPVTPVTPATSAAPVTGEQPWAPKITQPPEILTVKPPDELAGASPSASGAQTWTCPQCSNTNDWSRLFCSSCGYARGQDSGVSRMPTQPVQQPIVAPSRSGPSLAVILAGLGAVALLAIGGIVIGGLIVGPKASQSITPTQTSANGGGGGGSTENPTETPNVGSGVTLGDYSGQTPADARAAIEGLCQPTPCVTVRYAGETSTDVGFRQVIRTDPGNGEQTSPGDTVTVYVSVGDQSDQGLWFKATETNKTFSCIANRYGFVPWENLKPSNPVDDYDHYAAGDLIWIPGDGTTFSVSDGCKAKGAEEPPEP
jgi:hypothetical protein